jgi:nucleoside-diphosphate-sugar epimerase
MKRVLITGATGLLGQGLISRLALQKDIGSLVLLTRANIRGSPDKKVHMVYGDLCRSGLGLSPEAKKLVSDIDEVYHLAANTNLTCRNSGAIMQTNVQGTRNLLEVIIKNLPVFNYVSSAYACGISQAEIPEEWLERPKQFRNPYEESKWAAEAAIQEYAKNSGLPCRIYRPSILAYSNPANVDLAKQTFYAYASIISKAGKMPHSTEPIRLFGAPSSQINIIFSENVINLMLETRQSSERGIFNLTSDSNLYVQTLVDIVAELNNDRRRYILTQNLGSLELSDSERYAYERLEHFRGYLDTPCPKWSIENTTSARDRLGIKGVTEKEIKENLRRYLKT